MSCQFSKMLIIIKIGVNCHLATYQTPTPRRKSEDFIVINNLQKCVHIIATSLFSFAYCSPRKWLFPGHFLEVKINFRYSTKTVSRHRSGWVREGAILPLPPPRLPGYSRPALSPAGGANKLSPGHSQAYSSTVFSSTINSGSAGLAGTT